MSKSEDETSIVLMGTDATQNELHQTLGGYEHISEAFELAIPTFKKLRIIKHKIRATEQKSDWLDALIVAINFLRNNAE
jgi:Ku70/Ku80 N-terminal alpha/beta domain